MFIVSSPPLKHAQLQATVNKHRKEHFKLQPVKASLKEGGVLKIGRAVPLSHSVLFYDQSLPFSQRTKPQ
ncbi:hypothetical protein J4Q44_G00247990 [Coregonus suidteri]|uniref:Uncharacterized protein n=1 Tax=Coregonus suidteri TaxID=861788 RepID=A0AAN8L4N7_9TELE